MRIRIGSLLAVAALGLLSGAGTALAAPSEQDTAWMAAAHQSNLFEIAAGEAALEQAASDEVRRLGQMFIDMHSQLDAELTAAAGELGVTLPDAMSAEQQQSLERVSAQTGEAFDTAWVADQIAGHRMTLAATQTEIETGSDPTVVTLATNAAPVIEQHLAELEQLTDSAGAPTAVQTGDGGLLAASDDGNSLAWLLATGGAALIAMGVAVAAYAPRRR